MRQVAILGIGQTAIGEHWDRSLREIGGQAALAALHDAGLEKVEALYVGNMLSPLVSGQNQLGAFFSDWIGLGHQEAVKLEAACGSGAAAFRAALMAVASGEVESALALGVEKMTDKAGHDVTAALATAADADYEVEQGVSFVGLNALIMQRYMHEFGWKHGDFAPFSINAHANAVHNPFARLRERISLEKFEKASMIATPINLLDASPIGDGAAAAVLVPAEKVKPLPGRPRVVVAASASATDTIAVHSRKDPLFLAAANESAGQCSGWRVMPDDIVFSATQRLLHHVCALTRPAVLRGAVRVYTPDWKHIGIKGIPICCGGLKRIVWSAPGCTRSRNRPATARRVRQHSGRATVGGPEHLGSSGTSPHI
jgi:acetyl-CoA C-acetyltransferase